MDDMFCELSRTNPNIINIHNDKMVKQVTEHIVHQGLEDWGN